MFSSSTCNLLAVGVDPWVKPPRSDARRLKRVESETVQIISGDERSLAISNSKQQSQQTPRGDSVMADASGELLFKARLQLWRLFGARGSALRSEWIYDLFSIRIRLSVS